MLYLFILGESGRKNCTQEAFLGMFTWYEASDDCRNRGGNLGDMNFYDYSSLVDGVYWYGGRRWWMEQNPRSKAWISELTVLTNTNSDPFILVYPISHRKVIVKNG